VCAVQRGQRLVATATTAVAIAATVVALPVLTGPQASARPVAPVVTQVPLAGIDLAGLHASSAPLPEPIARVVDATYAAPAGAAPATRVMAPAVVTAATSTAPFSLIGVDWSGPTPAGTTVQVRVRENGSWDAWSQLDVVPDHGPDADSAEARAAGVRTGTEPLMTALGSDGVQVRIDSLGGVVPTDARVTLVDPRSSAADAAATPLPLSTAQAAGDPLRPAIVTRAQWGADEALRSRGPIYTGSVKVGFVHHTASTSSYTPAQATAQVRALYAWYTLGLHYSDIAYNVLVDRYGRLYEGRAGGLDRNVLGGHTAGFNQNTFAISAIGNFDTYNPPPSESTAMVTAIARFMAWKLALNHRDPLGTATLVSDSSAGTSRFAVGQKATVPVISGHRDIGSTACPGRYLEQYVPRIRALARQYMGTQLLNPVASPSVTPYAGTGTTVRLSTTTPLRWTAEVLSVCQDLPIRVLTGTQRAAGPLSIRWDQMRGDGTPALPGTYRIVLSGSYGAKVAYPAEVRYVVTPTATSPLGPCAQAARLVQAERYSASVEAGRLAAPASRVVVLAPGADAGLPEALLAAPLAAVKSAPRLLTTPASLPAVVAADIRARRAATAYLVGSATQITAAVEAQLRTLGVTTVVRLTGPDRAATAAAVADATGVRGGAVAVSFDPAASLDLAVAAASDASWARLPLVVVTRTGVPAATSAALTRLGVRSVVVAAPVAAVPDPVVARLPGAVRVAGLDDPTMSASLAAALAASATRVSLLTVASVTWRAVAAGAGRPVLLSTTSTAAASAWLSSHPRVVSVLGLGPWSDAALGTFAGAIAARTTPTSPAPATPLVPATFTFSGSGSGHGVGMSQYGARGMALEGRTATQIVQHYYAGTTVGAVADGMDIRVGIGHQWRTVVLRSEPLVRGGGGIEVTVSGRPAVLGGPGDVFTVTSRSRVVTVRRTRAGVTTTVGSGAVVAVRWAGTRHPGRAGTGATVVDVATTVAGLASTGHRYRYGSIDLAATTASPDSLEVVTSVRLHDEYLLGIGEVPATWPAAALEAQLLAARSYTLVHYGTGVVRPDCRCQVDDGNGPYRDLAFVGYARESGPSGALWRAAVRSTAVTTTTGRAVISRGRPIAAYSFAASGGATQGSQDVWATSLPYAQSVDDHWSLDPSVPWATWRPQVRTQVQLAAAFGLTDVVRVDLSARTTAGGVRTATAWSSRGVAATIRGELLRSRLALPSTWVWRAVESAVGDQVTTAARVASTRAAADVVVAPVESPALVAVAGNLAAQKGWAVLLVTRSAVPTVTRTELARRKAARIHVVGTTTRIPAVVMTALQRLSPAVTRYAGATDSDVSVSVANALGRPAGTPVLVASATDAASAALAAAAASASRRPLLLVPGGTGVATAVTAYLAARVPSRTWVVGPTSAIATSVTTPWRNAVRVSGQTVVDTSTAVLGTLGGPTPARVVLATVTGVTVAMLSAPGSPLVVVGTSLPAPVARLLQGGVATLVVTTGVGPAVVTAARRA
jgi:SpoIID/LytB domain protein